MEGDHVIILCLITIEKFLDLVNLQTIEIYYATWFQQVYLEMNGGKNLEKYPHCVFKCELFMPHIHQCTLTCRFVYNVANISKTILQWNLICKFYNQTSRCHVTDCRSYFHIHTTFSSLIISYVYHQNKNLQSVQYLGYRILFYFLDALLANKMVVQNVADSSHMFWYHPWFFSRSLVGFSFLDIAFELIRCQNEHCKAVDICHVITWENAIFSIADESTDS